MRIALLVADGAFDSGLSTVSDIFTAANFLRSEVENPPPVSTPDELTGRPDVLLVSAFGLRSPAELMQAASSATLSSTVDLIASAGERGVELAGACSGTLLLAQAGVLNGREATTSWWLGSRFREQYPAVLLDTRATLVVADGAVTAGAAFAHIDLALSLVHRQSPQLADLVARYLLIGERASQASFAVPAMMARNSPETTAFERWVRANLDQPIRVTDAAAAIGVSERTLQRTAQTVLGMSPLEFINEIRLDEATHLLRTTTQSVDRIASRVGFANSTTLRALLRRRRGVTIREVRADGLEA
jgi:transcriptional regulator GlxA family with amidase domain